MGIMALKGTEGPGLYSRYTLLSGHVHRGFLLHTRSPPAQNQRGQPTMVETYKTMNPSKQALCFFGVLSLGHLFQ